MARTIINSANVRIELSFIDELRAYYERCGDFAAASVLFALTQAPDTPDEVEDARAYYYVERDKEAAS